MGAGALRGGSRSDDLVHDGNVDRRGDRSLTLRHFSYEGRPLGKTRDDVLHHVASLWGFKVRLEEQDEQGKVRLIAETVVDRRKASAVIK